VLPPELAGPRDLLRRPGEESRPYRVMAARRSRQRFQGGALLAPRAPLEPVDQAVGRVWTTAQRRRGRSADDEGLVIESVEERAGAVAAAVDRRDRHDGRGADLGRRVAEERGQVRRG
jgi:hypothetical protein